MNGNQIHRSVHHFGSPADQELNHPVLSALPRAISITSGKGGVGKTNIVTNLAVSSALRGQKVLIIDCDLGLSNIDVMMGLNPRYNLLHALRGEVPLKDVLVTGPAGVRVLPAPFGIQEITHLSREQRLNLLAILERMDEEFDLIYLDTGAGISSNVMFFNMLANHIVVVMTPDPSSMTDAYALIKIMSTRFGESRFHLLVNLVRSEADGLAYYRKLTGVTHNFLNVSVDYVGCLPTDPQINRATLMCRPVASAFPTSAITQRFLMLAERIERFPAAVMPKRSKQGWMNEPSGSGEQPEQNASGVF